MPPSTPCYALLVDLRFAIFPLHPRWHVTPDFLLDVIFQHEFNGRVFVSGVFSRYRHGLTYESKDFAYLFQWHRGPPHVKAEPLLVDIWYVPFAQVIVVAKPCQAGGETDIPVGVDEYEFNRPLIGTTSECPANLGLFFRRLFCGLFLCLICTVIAFPQVIVMSWWILLWIHSLFSPIHTHTQDKYTRTPLTPLSKIK